VIPTGFPPRNPSGRPSGPPLSPPAYPLPPRTRSRIPHVQRGKAPPCTPAGSPRAHLTVARSSDSAPLKEPECALRLEVRDGSSAPIRPRIRDRPMRRAADRAGFTASPLWACAATRAGPASSSATAAPIGPSTPDHARISGRRPRPAQAFHLLHAPASGPVPQRAAQGPYRIRAISRAALCVLCGRGPDDARATEGVSAGLVQPGWSAGSSPPGAEPGVSLRAGPAPAGPRRPSRGCGAHSSPLLA
jgi:hypothetical protein